MVRRFTLAFLLSMAAAVAQNSVNLRDYGAIPNDNGDDSAAIQAAFDAIDPVQGGTVTCPVGVYDISTTIIVRASAVRLIGGGGPSFNEDEPFSGCTFVARTKGMTLMRFDAGVLDHRGPVIEYVNFREGTRELHTVVLLEIARFNRWTVRNVSVNYGAVGLRIDAGNEDASWGYIPQLVCRESNICVEQAALEGGFLLVGGDLEPLVTGVRIRGSQARIVGAKIDCSSASTGVLITGHAAVVSSTSFEQCGTGIMVLNDQSAAWSGQQNRFLGNHFVTGRARSTTGILLGTGTSDNQVIGNTYEYVGANVDDRGTNTVRLEQGAGFNGTVNCQTGEAVRGITVKQGVVTGVTCGRP